MKPSTLYLCYFGLREPLVQTQVLPYLRQLVADGIAVHLLTFEPDARASWAVGELDAMRARLSAEGIEWFCLPYHKRPTLPATLYDMAAGVRFGTMLVRRRGIQVIHARSHVPALMGRWIKRLTGARFIFDIRGFLPDEYVDAGVWPAGGYLYRLTKRAEKSLFAHADAFVVLTEQARRILFGGGGGDDAAGATTDARGRPVEVIPCCVDAARFEAANEVARADVRAGLGLDAGRRVIAYVGALGGWYLTDEMADFLAAAHRQDARTFSLILTQSPAEVMAQRLCARGVDGKDFLVRRVAPAEVPRYLKAADAALSFIKPCYSKRASSPTKVAETLLAGLPLVSNTGIGDLDEMIETERVGVLVREFNEAAYRRALLEMDALCADPEIGARCRATARVRFDLETVGGVRYRRLYHRLLGGDATSW